MLGLTMDTSWAREAKGDRKNPRRPMVVILMVSMVGTAKEGGSLRKGFVGSGD